MIKKEKIPKEGVEEDRYVVRKINDKYKALKVGGKIQPEVHDPKNYTYCSFKKPWTESTMTKEKAQKLARDNNKMHKRMQPLMNAFVKTINSPEIQKILNPKRKKLKAKQKA